MDVTHVSELDTYTVSYCTGHNFWHFVTVVSHLLFHGLLCIIHSDSSTKLQQLPRMFLVRFVYKSYMWFWSLLSGLDSRPTTPLHPPLPLCFMLVLTYVFRIIQRAIHSFL